MTLKIETTEQGLCFLQLYSDHRNDFIRVHKKDIFLAYNKLDTKWK